jgi:transposase
MLGLSGATRILLFISATDMRKGFDGLSTLVMAAGEDLYSGHLFVFVSRRRDRAKILTFQKGGLVLWYKRLDRGRFQIRLAEAGDRAELDATQLAMLIDGIDFSRVKRPKHWQPTPSGKTLQKIDKPDHP